MNVYCLYFPNGRRYVGIESKTGQRISDHSRSRIAPKAQLVTKAIAEHGWDKIRWRYLAVNCSAPEGQALERFFIKHMGLQNQAIGYNVSGGVQTGGDKEGLYEIRCNIDDFVIERLRKRTGVKNASDLGRAALELLDWAVQQNQAGRQIAASDKSGNHYVPVTPVVNHFPYTGE